MQKAAEDWIRANCTDRNLVRHMLQNLFDARTAGLNCWFIIGGGLTRPGTAFMVHCFAQELFAFQLTDEQAAKRRVVRGGLRFDTDDKGIPKMKRPTQIAVSLERLEMDNPVLTQATPAAGRVYYEVLARETGPLCLRFDETRDKRAYRSLRYIYEPLRGKGVLEFSFPSIGRGMTPSFNGPMALFARLVEVGPPDEKDAWPAVSNAVAAMVEME